MHVSRTPILFSVSHVRVLFLFHHTFTLFPHMHIIPYSLCAYPHSHLFIPCTYFLFSACFPNLCAYHFHSSYPMHPISHAHISVFKAHGSFILRVNLQLTHNITWVMVIITRVKREHMVTLLHLFSYAPCMKGSYYWDVRPHSPIY